MSLFRLAVLAISFAATYVLSKMGPGAIAPEDLRSDLTTLVGAASALLGFLVSAGALLYAVANTTLARNLQRTGHFQALLSDLFFCAGAYFVALGVSAACLFIPVQKSGAPGTTGGFSMLEVGMGFVVLFNIAAYLLLIPVGHKMWLLLSNIQPERAGRLE